MRKADHDGGYKLLFSHPKLVEELLRGFVHEPWVAELDFSTLEPYHTTMVGTDQHQRHMDVVWRLRRRGAPPDDAWFYVYLLLEFQSKPDTFMALRLLTYVGLLLEDLLRKPEVNRATGLPAVLPLVLYNGRRTWRAPTRLADLFKRVPPGFEHWLPQLNYLLIDEGRLSPEALALAGNRVATLFQLEKAEPADLPRLTAELAARLPEGKDPELRDAFAGWLLRLLQRSFKGATIPVEVDDLQEVTMLEQTLRDWWKGAVRTGETRGEARGLRKGKATGLREGKASGLREGKATGLREAVLRVLAQRFGELPQQVRSKVASLESVAELERLLDRAVIAGSLEELRFG